MAEPKPTIDAAAVVKLARLAQLALDDDEVQKLVPELDAIVDHVRQLQSVDVDGLEPMTHGHPAGAQLQKPFAKSDVEVLGRTAVAQSAGFDDVDGTIAVPKVID